jgi:hypothetical protein
VSAPVSLPVSVPTFRIVTGVVHSETETETEVETRTGTSAHLFMEERTARDARAERTDTFLPRRGGCGAIQ